LQCAYFARNVYCGLDYLSPAFRAAIGEARIELLTYKNIVRELGPDSMYPPEDLASYNSSFTEED